MICSAVVYIVEMSTKEYLVEVAEDNMFAYLFTFVLHRLVAILSSETIFSLPTDSFAVNTNTFVVWLIITL